MQFVNNCTHNRHKLPVTRAIIPKLHSNPCDYLYKAPEVQVRMKFSVVTEVSTYLIITQVSSGLKIFSFLANVSISMLR